MTAFPVWALRLVPDAAGGCGAGFLLTAAALGAVLLGTVAVEPRLRPAFLRGVLALAVLALAWIFRDRLLLLSDSRLWIHTAEAFGSRVPHYRAPLGSTLLGGAGTLGPARVTLPLVALAGGVLTAGAMAWGVRRPRGAVTAPGAPARSRTPSALFVLVLCFAQPLSFVFYGHVETYPLLAAALAFFLGALARDLPRPPSPITLLAFVLLGATHVLGLLAAGPILAAGFSGRRRPGRVLLLFAGFLIALGVGVAAVPAFREHSPALSGWSAGTLAAYAVSVGNGWLLLSVPVFLAWPARRRLAADPMGRILALAAATYLVLPLVARFDLGIYRDLDLLTPAFVCLTFLAVWGIALDGPGRMRRRLWTLAPSVLVLAALVTLTRCPQGEAVMQRRLERGAMTEGARSYGYEVLAYARLDAGDPAGAETMVRRSIAVTPGNRRLYGPLGEMQLAQGDTAAAIASLEQSMSSPRAPLTAPLLGELLTRTGDPAGAIRLLAARRTEVLRSSRGAAALAVAYFQVGLPESTVAVATDRLRLTTRDPLAHFNAASGLAALGRYPEAARALRAALALDPGNVLYHRSLIRVLRLLPDGDAQIQAYLRSLPPALAREVTGRR